MALWVSAAIIIVSLVVLERGAEYLVEGLGSLSDRFGISEAVVGASIAAVGSSMPEFGSAVFSVVENEPTIGFGTIVGSAIFNITVIIGGSALFGKVVIDKKVIYRDGLFYLFTVVVALVGIRDGRLTRTEALAWAALFGVYLVWLVYDARRGEPVPNESFDDLSTRLSAAYVVGGLVATGIAARYLVVHVEILSVELGISTAIFSLVAVAAGTSVPDLFTSLQSARKGMGSLAVANAIGSNIFDILGGLGIPFAFRAVTSVEAALNLSALVLLGSVVLALFVVRWGFSLTRPKGYVLIGAYVTYLAVLFAQTTL